MIVKVDGFVSGVTECGESDKMVTLITRQYGKMSVYCRGARKLNSKLMMGTLKYSYGEYIINRTEKMNIMTESNAEAPFFDLFKNVTAASLADYISEVLSDVSMAEEPDEPVLNLALNCLYVLSNGKYSERTVKTVFELKLTEYLGIAPDLSGCFACGKTGKEWYFLDVMNGYLICEDCGKGNTGNEKYDDGTARIVVMLSAAEAYSLNRVITAEKSSMFSLPEDEKLRRRLSEISELYLLNHLERNFKTLDFYKEISKL